MYITVITLAVFATLPLVYGSFIRELVGKPDDVPPLDQALNEEWTEYKLSYNKTYQSAADERYRRYVWEDNLALINKHNREAAKGHQSYWMGVNQFTDMTSDELISLMLPGDALLEFNATAEESDDDAWVTLPTSVDWRKKGLVTGVKNQGGCGSCWAFSTTGAIEGQHAKKTGKLLSLSEQELIDCSRGFGNRGCHGGWPITAYKYVIQNKGLDTESCYPYRAQDRKCSKKPSCIGATLKSYKQVPVGENNLQKAVAEVGPISVVVKFTSNFIHYSGGLYVDHTCNTSKTLHAILAVGYTPDYWIIKNSWGPGWGIQGYIHWARNRHNMCDVSSYASYPEAA